MKVGDTVWTFDGNRRVYRKAAPGRIWSDGGPIYREHFRPEVIVGETRDSWLIGPAWSRLKVNKRTQKMRGGTGLSSHVFFSQQEVDDDVWVNDTRHVIARRVSECRDAAVLRRIAALLPGASSVTLSTQEQRVEYEVVWSGATHRQWTPTLGVPAVSRRKPDGFYKGRLLEVLGDYWQSRKAVQDRARMSPNRIGEYLTRLIADGLVEKTLVSRGKGNRGRAQHFYRKRQTAQEAG